MKTITTSRFHFIFLAVCLLLLSGMVIGSELRTVTTLEDTNDGVCDAHCSLREAVVAAVDGDTVIFARPLRGGTIHLQDTLVIEKDLKIDGPNRRRITLKGNGKFGVLYIGTATGAWKFVGLDGLIIRDGAELGGLGGGIYIYGSRVVTLSDCLVTENRAAIGGGIRVLHGALYVFNSTISGNQSDGTGGAAGIDARNATLLEIVNSTIAANIAEDGVAGIKNDNDGHSLLLNSTISGNISSGSGLGRVGGMYTDHSQNFLIINSVIAGNIGATPDAWLWNTWGGNNLIGVGEGSRFTNGVGGNIVGTRANPVDPRLGPLTDNGRGLPTYAPQSASPVTNAGNAEHLIWYQSFERPFFSSAADQRGFTRIFENQIEIGAVEYGGSAVPTTTTIIGRILNGERGVPRAFVTVRDADGEARTAITNPFGYYRVVGLPVDTQFTVEVKNKSFTFQPQTLLTEETVEYLDFVSK